MKNILFFNDWHNGDIHMSRNYIKDLMNIFGENKYYSFHVNNPEILIDIPKLEHTDVKDGFDLIINTWVNQHKNIIGFHGCNFLHYYNTMKITYTNLGIVDQIKDIEFYIPCIDYTKINTQNCIKYLSYKRKFILICNNDVHSSQADNFDMSSLVNTAADVFFEYDILVTNFNSNIVKKENIFFCSDITKKPNGFDLNEISYLSTFSSLIIGRSSGPYSFSIVQENYKRNIPYICITHKQYDSWYTNNNSNIIWLNSYNVENLINLIKENLK